MTESDETALEALYDRFVSHVFGLALKVTRDSGLAEEVVSDTFLQAWRTASSFDLSRGKPIAWLLTIARYRSIDALRRRDRAMPAADPHEIASQQTDGSCSEPESSQWSVAQPDDPADQLADGNRDKALCLALEALSAVQRQLISLAFFQGLSHSEIAAHINMPLGTVKSHLRRGQEQLRTLLADNQVKREASQ
ncbi:MAG: sigma-70 family RNA polymerase sigma factor [Burkholderiaceae bacterium]